MYLLVREDVLLVGQSAAFSMARQQIQGHGKITIIRIIEPRYARKTHMLIIAQAEVAYPQQGIHFLGIDFALLQCKLAYCLFCHVFLKNPVFIEIRIGIFVFCIYFRLDCI